MAGFVDMANTPKEIAEEKAKMSVPVAADMPKYPWGLCIRLGSDELKKLGLDADCSVGDIMHGAFLAEVTSCSKRSTESGDECNIELQITHLRVEDEGGESAAEMANEVRAQRSKRRYGDDEGDDE